MPSRTFCRSTLRRLHRRDHSLGLAQEVATALNELHSGVYAPGGDSSRQIGLPSLAQRRALDNIVQSAVSFRAPPSDMIRQGALRELLAKHGYVGEAAALAPLDVDLLALPLASFRSQVVKQDDRSHRGYERPFCRKGMGRLAFGRRGCAGLM